MRATIAILTIVMLVLVGCGSVPVQEEPVKDTPIIQTSLADMVQEEGTQIVQREIRIVDYQIDPEEVTVPSESVLEFSIESDANMILSFPGFDEDVEIVNTSIMTLTFMVEEPGTYEYFCVEGCPVPLLGTITAE